MNDPHSSRILVLVEELYEDLELWHPVLRLREAGADVVIAGPRANSFGGIHGYSVHADRSFAEVSPERFDALMIPGGPAVERLRRTPAVKDLVRRMNEGQQVLAAAGSAVHVLVDAGAVRGRRVAANPSDYGAISAAGGEPTDAGICRDGLLVTSRHLSDIGPFAAELLRAIAFRNHLLRVGRKAPVRAPGASGQETIRGPRTHRHG